MRKPLSSAHSELKLREKAERQLQRLYDARVTGFLAQLPLDALKSATNGRLRFSGMEKIGITTVADVRRASVAKLTQVNGVGEQTARRMIAAANTLYQEALARYGTPFIGDEPLPSAVELVRILALFEKIINHLSYDERERRDQVITFIGSMPGIGKHPWGAVFTEAGGFAQLNHDLEWVASNPQLFWSG